MICFDALQVRWGMRCAVNIVYDNCESWDHMPALNGSRSLCPVPSHHPSSSSHSAIHGRRLSPDMVNRARI